MIYFARPYDLLSKVYSRDFGVGGVDGFINKISNEIDKKLQDPQTYDCKNSYLEVQVMTESDVPVRDVGETSQGMVLYKGAMIDIANLLSRLERSERDRIAIEEKVADQQADLEYLRAMISSSEETTKTLASELKEVKEKLSDTTKTMQDVEKTCGSYRELLDIIHLMTM
ncbi:CCAR1 [Branchiostoma lanceolatum]|uniref:CCAR1 protein n=1 Tax=Branchiostoma lanceolatum TaxID=7740 RepID=A0A8S4MPG2_BRALA|nr:CCAR1 [Branchiostoma lanceolatum]